VVVCAAFTARERRRPQACPGFGSTLPAVRYGNAERVEAFIRQAVERTAAIPGIRATGATTT
jgi:hypothetical protein